MESQYDLLLERFRRMAIDEYGAERADDPVFRAALEVAVKHVALVAQVPLDLTGPDPDHV